MDSNICPICGHTLIVIKDNRVSCPYCENFYPDTHWAKLKEEKIEKPNRKTTNFFERLIR